MQTASLGETENSPEKPIAHWLEERELELKSLLEIS